MKRSFTLDGWAWLLSAGGFVLMFAILVIFSLVMILLHPPAVPPRSGATQSAGPSASQPATLPAPQR